ncbi:MAG: SDR family NAD(P)-dependent oxidoreductase [Thermaerobacter sp.]|nr:SDR family NAD(P)-dependent oxidoreductase [Thermaerobacter sp.]
MAKAPDLGTVLVVGVGMGLGAALSRRFAAVGAPVAIGARSEEAISQIAAEIRTDGGRALALPYDAADEQAVGQAIGRAEQELGPIGCLIYNAGNAMRGGVEAVTPHGFEAAWRVGPYGAYLHAHILVPKMIARGFGAALFSGATSSVRSPAHSIAFGSAKFGLRGFAMSLSRAVAKDGVHVAHVLLDGAIRTPHAASYLSPDEPALVPEDIAETYYQLAVQPPSAWTFEIDMRPSGDDLMDN